MSKLSFSVSMTSCGPPAEYAALIRLRPMPGTLTIRSRGNDTTSVRCAPGSTWATISVSELLPASPDFGAERVLLVGGLDELPGVAPDDQEVRALGRHLRGDQLDALDLLHPRVDLVVDTGHGRGGHRRREHERDEEAPREGAHGRARDRRHATQLRKWRDGALRGARGATGRATGTPLRVRPAPWWAWRRCPSARVEPTPLKPGPRTRTMSPPTVPSAASSAPGTMPATIWAFASSPGR